MKPKADQAVFGDKPRWQIRRVWQMGELVRRSSAARVGYRPKGNAAELRSRWRGDHALDLRASIPLPGGRWYVTVVAGRERRSLDRLKAEGQLGWTRKVVVYAMLSALLAWLILAVIAVLYLIKSALGVDVLEGASPLHPLWEWFESL